MSSGSCLTSKLYDKIIKMQSKSQEPIPLRCIILLALLLSLLTNNPLFAIENFDNENIIAEPDTSKLSST
jgi:hypothetical protein